MGWVEVTLPSGSLGLECCPQLAALSVGCRSVENVTATAESGEVGAAAPLAW